VGSAKGIRLRPIDSRAAGALIRRVHYSGTTGHAPHLNIGVYWNGSLEGAIQFGQSIDKRRMLGIVRGTRWNQFTELNRLAFTDRLPRNSESRALGIAFRLLKRHRPDLKWIVSYADATACGDGAIYRASGFVLTAIRPNRTILVFPDGERVASPLLSNARMAKRAEMAKKWRVQEDGSSSVSPFVKAGAKWAKGCQLRYIRFLDPTWRERLTVPEIPFSAIPETARMYRGVRRPVEGQGASPPADGADPIPPLHTTAGRADG